MTLAQKALAVAVAIAAMAAVYFCLWAGAIISDTHTKTVEMHAIMTAKASARDAQIDAGRQENADNISSNTNRLDALENEQRPSH